MANPEILDGTGDMINLFGFGFARGKGQIDKGDYESFEEISYSSGTCMFLPKKIIHDSGCNLDIKFSKEFPEVTFVNKDLQSSEPGKHDLLKSEVFFKSIL